MMTGNLQNLRDRETGKLILSVSRFTGADGMLAVGPDGYTYSASIDGWHRGHNVGTGPTEDAAIRDLARQCGSTPSALLDAAVVERAY